jgi:hypothetical protein
MLKATNFFWLWVAVGVGIFFVACVATSIVVGARVAASVATAGGSLPCYTSANQQSQDRGVTYLERFFSFFLSFFLSLTHILSCRDTLFLTHNVSCGETWSKKKKTTKICFYVAM